MDNIQIGHYIVDDKIIYINIVDDAYVVTFSFFNGLPTPPPYFGIRHFSRKDILDALAYQKAFNNKSVILEGRVKKNIR